MRAGDYGHRKDAESAGGYHHAVQGSTLAFQSALGSTVWLIVRRWWRCISCSAFCTRALFTRHHSLDATHGRCWRPAGVNDSGSELDVIAIIGIILLIGIVRRTPS